MTKDLKILAVIFAVPIIPFLLCGWYLESQIMALLEGSWLRENAWLAAGLGIGLLLLDIFLPVPSSAVGTFLGASLGAIGGTAVTWLGLSLGAWGGYELARSVCLRRPNRGLPAFQRVRELNDKLEVGTLAVCRGIPVLAEASVLFAGFDRMPRWKFWLIVGPANFGLAIAYAVLGALAYRANWLPMALGVSLALPAIGLWLLARRYSAASDSR